MGWRVLFLLAMFAGFFSCKLQTIQNLIRSFFALLNVKSQNRKEKSADYDIRRKQHDC